MLHPMMADRSMPLGVRRARDEEFLIEHTYSRAKILHIAGRYEHTHNRTPTLCETRAECDWPQPEDRELECTYLCRQCLSVWKSTLERASTRSVKPLSTECGVATLET